MRNKQIVVVASLMFATLISVVAYAATNVFSNHEAEAGMRTGAVSVVADTSAAGSSAVKFGVVTGSCVAST